LSITAATTPGFGTPRPVSSARQRLGKADGIDSDDLIVDALRRRGAMTFEDLVRALRPRGVRLGDINLWLSEARARGTVEDAGRRHVNGPRSVREFRLAGRS
jgi:hypothetical protein